MRVALLLLTGSLVLGMGTGCATLPIETAPAADLDWLTRCIDDATSYVEENSIPRAKAYLELLKDKVNSLIQQGHQKLLLNLEGVPYVDSAGLGEIVRTYTTVSRQGGKLKLLNLTKRIEDLLAITKLLTVFETFESEQEAVKSFST